MTPELTVLILAIVLHLGLMVGYSIKANTELGTRYPLSPRDTAPPPISTVLGRIQRTMNNSFEGLILFAPVALVIGLTGQSSPVTAAFAWLFLAARVLYIPAYIGGFVPWRSYIWSLSFFAILALAIAALI